MTISLQSIVSSEPQKTSFRPRIVIIGVGGAGGNAVNNMIRSGLDGVEFYVVNTDAQALEYSLSENKIQIGKNLTSGLGAGAFPEVGKKAAEESAEEIARITKGANMVFVTAGMGGGTGTGASPIVAKIARDSGALTVCVVTRPFIFEGKLRQKAAEEGIKDLSKHADTLISISNQNLFRVANERTSLHDAFKMADEVLYSSVRGVTDLMTMPGLVNLDFADIRTIMENMGHAMMSAGEASGEDRAVKAADLAIVNPLLDIGSIAGAKAVLINITGGLDMTLFEINDAVERIRAHLDESAHIIFGAICDQKNDGVIRVSVVATGVHSDSGILDLSKGDSKNHNDVHNERNNHNSHYNNRGKENSKLFDAKPDLFDELDEDSDTQQIRMHSTVNLRSDKVQNSIEANKDMEDDINELYVMPSIQEVSSREYILRDSKKNDSSNASGVSRGAIVGSDMHEKKKSIGNMLENIIFGTQKEKKTLKNSNIAAFDIFEQDISRNVRMYTNSNL